MAGGADATVWLLDTGGLDPATLARWEARLGGSEHARLVRFRRAARRRQFIAGRMLLRHALMLQSGASGDCGPIAVTERPGQAPLVTSASGAYPYFSLSHSGHWVACAVGTGCAVGVDVEVPDPSRDVAALAAQAFSSADAAVVAALDGLRRVPAFYQLWCAYEARCKLGAEHGSDGHLYRVHHAAVEIALCTALPLAASPGLRVVIPAALG
jgi:4'-phosphopantetheinyl transferase